MEALKLHADVLVLDSDFDLAAVAAAFRPDMIIFAALETMRPTPVRIINGGAHPGIPRVLYLGSGAYDPLCGRSLAMADSNAVEAIFVTSDADRQRLLEPHHRPVFVIGRFVDAAEFRDHGQPRRIPISVFGDSSPASHPWRVAMVAALDGIVPVMVFPHPASASGPAYARMINRSAFVMADTTLLDQLNRQHLEIPAAGAVLVAPKSDSLARYGFVDGENCLLGEGPALVAELAALTRNPDRYGRIRHAGHTLVHRRYTRDAWTPLLDWLDCRSALRNGEEVLQAGPLGHFHCGAAERAEAGSATTSKAARRSAALREAILSGGELAKAEAETLDIAA